MADQFSLIFFMALNIFSNSRSIFHRALVGELLNTAGAVFVGLFTIFVTMTLVKLMSQAASGRIASESLIAMLSFAALNALPIILPATLFIAVLLVLTRWHRDQEMVIWFSAGLSHLDWIRPILQVALPWAFLVLLLSSVITPWANRQSAELRERFERRTDLTRVSPGQFSESSHADRVFFVESLAADKSTVKNVFVSQQRSTKQGVEHSIVFSSDGVIERQPNGEQFLVMHNGRRYDGIPGQADFKIMEFARYGVLINAEPSISPILFSNSAIPTHVLWKQIRQSSELKPRGEFVRRIAWALMTINLALLAIPLSYVALRAGRSLHVVFALFLFMIYNNGVAYVEARVIQGRLNFETAWWVAHACALLIVIWFYFWRMSGQHWAQYGWGRLRQLVLDLIRSRGVARQGDLT